MNTQSCACLEKSTRWWMVDRPPPYSALYSLPLSTHLNSPLTIPLLVARDILDSLFYIFMQHSRSTFILQCNTTIYDIKFDQVMVDYSLHPSHLALLLLFISGRQPIDGRLTGLMLSSRPPPPLRSARSVRHSRTKPLLRSARCLSPWRAEVLEVRPALTVQD